MCASKYFDANNSLEGKQIREKIFQSFIAIQLFQFCFSKPSSLIVGTRGNTPVTALAAPLFLTGRTPTTGSPPLFLTRCTPATGNTPTTG